MLDELKTFIMRGNVVNLAVGDFSRLFPKPLAAPTTKECGFCATTIPLKARRCPPCTSELAAA
jgi:large conductance mechanosensitive channel